LIRVNHMVARRQRGAGFAMRVLGRCRQACSLRAGTSSSNVYPLHMHRILTTLLIALLAMRVLFGDAMAYGMVQQTSAPVEAVDISTQTTVAMPCHDVGADESASAETVVSACTTCQVCHLTLFLTAALQLPELQLPHTLLAQRVSAWQSADCAVVRKPPIL